MKRSIVFLLHCLVWLLLYGIAYAISSIFLKIVSPSYGTIPSQVSYVLAAYIVTVILIPFYSFYFITPQLLQNRNRLFGVLIAAFSLAIFPYSLLKIDNQDINFDNYVTALLFLSFFALLGGLFSSFFQWLKENQLRVNLERQQLRSELDLLRVQLNPHFLFNTLNNVDSLITQDPGKASRMLIQLSEMMRYMLYESQEDQVLLSREIDYLNQFISLQRLRYADESIIQFSFSGEPGSQTIAPMLLIPFVENAFKHYKPQRAATGIYINLDIQPYQLQLHCYNSYAPNDANKDKASGIGLNTIQQRLALLYPGKHKLLITEENMIFDVQLTLALDEF